MLEKFMESVYKDNDTGCWEWLGNKHVEGYGRFRYSGKTVRAHRFSYSMLVGDLGNDLCVCHKCDNRGCVNPDHLFLGTRADNNRDMVAKGRHKLPQRPEGLKGENHPLSKLTQENVDYIRRTYKPGVVTLSKLGDMFGVKREAISKIIHRRNWKD